MDVSEITTMFEVLMMHACKCVGAESLPTNDTSATSDTTASAMNGSKPEQTPGSKQTSSLSNTILYSKVHTQGFLL